ncbi:MAG: sigma 54-interacting transcriptional regulator [Planctomycetaceae bacterium]
MNPFLVVKSPRGHKVHRLFQEKTTTLGRDPKNSVVLEAQGCSRHHCEIYHRDGRWWVRDLNSRNGTRLDRSPLVGEAEFLPGSVLQVSDYELAMTYDLSNVPGELVDPTGLERPTDASFEAVGEIDTYPPYEPTIVTTTTSNPFLEGGTRVAAAESTSLGQLFTRLYRLSLAMAKATTSKALAETVLDGLSMISADNSAFLLLANPTSGATDPDDLQVLAYRSPDQQPYRPVSTYLSGKVLRERQAVLARDAQEDSVLSERDSLGQFKAKSLICAPIRQDATVYGLVHLYSSDSNRPLDEESLEYALAVGDQCAGLLANLLNREKLAEGLAQERDANARLREQLGLESELVGGSPSLQGLKQRIARIAPTDSTVLIRGESGVGKELVARAIHLSSRRRQGPFVCMNCAALTESLLESELFGHEKGSFTGATTRKLGKFEQAHHGTLFLDEVGEMSGAIQAKFLRVLEGHPFERVGGASPVQVDVRVVAATNRDLEQAVDSGQFRKDLYFRLQVVELHVEPLRDHPADIPLLAEHFLQRFARKSGRPIRGFTPAALAKLTGYDWPGNVRELQNTIERSVVLCLGEMVDASDVSLSGLGHLADVAAPRPSRDSSGAGEAVEGGAGAVESGAGEGEVSLEALEQRHILGVLDRTNWNKSQAAQILGIERSTLDRKLKRYRVTRPGPS